MAMPTRLVMAIFVVALLHSLATVTTYPVAQTALTHLPKTGELFKNGWFLFGLVTLAEVGGFIVLLAKIAISLLLPTIGTLLLLWLAGATLKSRLASVAIGPTWIAVALFTLFSTLGLLVFWSNPSTAKFDGGWQLEFTTVSAACTAFLAWKLLTRLVARADAHAA